MASFLQARAVFLRGLQRVPVLISFREWLHSYSLKRLGMFFDQETSSHLFQRVASFLHDTELCLILKFCGFVLISFREWLHSYLKDSHNVRQDEQRFSSLSESGFIPTKNNSTPKHGCCREGGSHLFQRVASFLQRLLTRPPVR